jgi:hypothetical protein
LYPLVFKSIEASSFALFFSKDGPHSYLAANRLVGRFTLPKTGIIKIGSQPIDSQGLLANNWLVKVAFWNRQMSAYQNISNLSFKPNIVLPKHRPKRATGDLSTDLAMENRRGTAIFLL